MKSHEVLRRSFKKVGAKRVARELKVSLSLVHQWCRPGVDGKSCAANPLDRIALMRQVTEDAGAVQWLCNQCGGFFVANLPVRALREKKMLPVMGGVMEELAKLQVALAGSLKGCRVSRTAAAELRELWDVLKSDMERCVKLCEGEGFAALLPPFKVRVFVRV